MERGNVDVRLSPFSKAIGAGEALPGYSHLSSDRAPDLGAYEELLLDQVLAIGPVTDARSTFAIRTVLSRGPLPLRQWPP